MRILDVAWKDLSQILRDWKAAAFLIGAPVLFTLLMGIMMGGLAGDPAEDPRLPVGVVDQDRGALSESLTVLLEGSDAVRPVIVEDPQTDLEKQVADGVFALVVVVPEGYAQSQLEGRGIPLRLIADEGSEAATKAIPAVQAALFRLGAAVEAARAGEAVADQQQAFTDASERDAFLANAVRLSVKEWESPPLTLTIRAAAVAGDSGAVIPSGFAQSSPGNMVTFALAGLIGAADIIVWERTSRTLQRLLTTSITRLEVLCGHFLAMAAMLFVQVLTLGTFGQLAFGLAYWQAPFAFLAMALSVTLWIAAMALFIGVISRTSEQVAMFSVVPMLVLAGLGGAWMPLEVTGETFQMIGRLTPTAWAMQGMQNLILRGQGLEGVCMPALILCGFGLIFFGLAAWRFRPE